MYSQSNKKQQDTIIGKNQVYLNPATGKPQEFKLKDCKFCGDEFQPVAPSHLYCSQDCSDNGWTEGYVHREYELSFEEWVCMYEKAGGRCDICGSRGFKINKATQMLLVVDHDHETGQVRGMLCHNCNRALGLLKDSTVVLRQAVEYLESSTTIT